MVPKIRIAFSDYKRHTIIANKIATMCIFKGTLKASMSLKYAKVFNIKYDYLFI